MNLCSDCWEMYSDTDFTSEGVHNNGHPYSYGDCANCGHGNKLRYFSTEQTVLEPVVVEAARSDLFRNLREISEL